jgi:hypothetical protein
MKWISPVLLACLFSASMRAQQEAPPSPITCPVIATLASSKVQNLDNKEEENIVIFFWNRGKKTAHGIEFRLEMLDTVGNKYPASIVYQVKGDTKPQNGDFVAYSTVDEKRFFGDKWESIDGVVVHVSKILFTDATIWTPPKGGDCKTSFLNDNYGKQIKLWDKAVSERMEASRKKWVQEHPDNQTPDSKDDTNTKQ